MKDIKALLDLRGGLFSTIEQLAKDKRFSEAYEVLMASSQPDEWISIGKSEIDGAEYKFNNIELIEGIMNRLFDWGYTIINVYTLNVQGRFATTAIVDVHYKFNGEAEYRHQGGGATSYCTDVKAIILATPKSISQAKKNACKYIGKLLGLDLNREQEELPIVSVKAEPSEMDKETEKELEILRQQIKAASTKELAQKLLDNSPFRLMPDLKVLVSQKIN
jgi:hypothetical protein